MATVVRIPAQFVSSDRLDARYNAPSAVQTRALIEMSGVHVRELGTVFKQLVCGPFGSTLTADQHTEDGEVLLAQPTNISDFLFDDTKSWRISRHTLTTAGLPLYPAGTLLFARVGIYPHVGMIPERAGYSTISSSMIAGVANGEVDHAYLLGLLRCSLGQNLLFAAQKVTAQPTIGTYEIAATRVPVPNPLAQRYIGDKVRQAERLRERARQLEAAVRRDYRAEIDRLGFVEVPHRKTFRTKLRDRLDPAYYDPAFTSVLDAPWLAHHAEPLSRFFSDGSYGDLPNSGTYGTGDKWLLRATDLDQCMTHWDAGLRVPAAEVCAKSEVKENDILLEVKGAIEKCAIGRGPAVGKHVNGTVFRLSPSGINAGYLCLHLTAEIKRKYAAREAVNNIIQYLNLDCIRTLPVLRLDVELEGRLGGSFIDAFDARTVATKLTSAAMTLVEQLIEGSVTEADLVAAQKALDGGDRNADRELLKALRESDAPDAKPLIADIDALYALLDGSERQDA